MNKHMYGFILGMVFFLFPFQAVGQQRSLNLDTALKPVVEIQDIRVVGSARTGDTFEIVVRYKTHLDIPANVSFRVPEHVSFPGRTTDVKSISEVRSFLSGQTRTERFQVRTDASGTGLYTIHFDIPMAPDEYNPSVERWIKIYTTDDEFDLFDPRNPGDRNPKIIGEDIETFLGDHPKQQKGKMQNMQVQSSQNYNVTVSGNIRFYSSFPEFMNRGVYGNSVVLWFRSSSNPTIWYHPVYAPDPVQGVHFDKLDDEGYFSFVFSFTGNLSGYDEVIVLVNASNDATFMPAPQDGYIVWSGNGYSSYYHESDGIVASFNPSQTTISVNQSNNSFPPDHGKIYRYLKQSREYVFELYNGNAPFNLPPIYTFLYDGNPQAAGGFCSVSNCKGLSSQPFGPYIFINPNFGSQIKTISHEYGHKVNFRMWNSSSNKMSNATLSVKEGWAEFFSFALRNFANRNYGDNLLSNRTNAEEAPFYTNRYAGFSYLGTDRNVAAFASYLWNLYDDPQDDTFLSNAYSIGDNDDIIGHSVRVFDAMRAIQGYYPNTIKISHFHNIFKLGLSSEEQSSINKVYEFMFDDLYEIPDVSMRSAQVTNFSSQVNGSTIDFSWQSQSYPSHLNFANIETGYRLYKSTGSGWSLIQSIPYGTNNFTYHSPLIYAHYKLTSYNSEGNSANAPVISIQPPALTVSLSGPSQLLVGSFFANYQATVSGGEPPFSYQWRRQEVLESGPTGQWELIQGATSSNYFYFPSNPEKFYLRVDVTDDLNRTDMDYMLVEVVGQSGQLSKETDLTEMEEEKELPKSFSLKANHPNPFNPTTVIGYEIPETAYVSINVYNIMGQHIQTLTNSTMNAGAHRVIFDGSHLSSGIYLVRMQAKGESGDVFVQDRQMQMIK